MEQRYFMQQRASALEIDIPISVIPSQKLSPI